MAKKKPDTVSEILEQLGEVQEEQPKQEDSNNQNNENVASSQEAELTENDIAYLIEQGMSEKELSDKTEEELLKLVKEKKEGQQEPSQKIIISEDLAKQIGGIAKSFVGKPVEDLFVALNEQNSYIGKLSSELQAVKRQLQEIQLQPAKQPEADKNNVQKFIEQNKQTEIQKAVEQAIKSMLPSLQELQQVSVEKRQQEIISEIQQKLAVKEKDDVLSIIKEFGNANELTDEDIIYYEKHPKKFIKDVVDYVKNKELTEELQRIKNQRSYEQKLEIARKIKSALKKSPESLKESAGSVRSSDDDKTLKTVREILQS